jgi:hypothetical protein
MELREALNDVPIPDASRSISPVDLDLDRDQLLSSLAGSSSATVQSAADTSAASCGVEPTSRREDDDHPVFPQLRLPSQRMQNVHERPCIQLLLVCIAYANTRYGVSHRACDFLLRCLRVIFIMAGVIIATSDFPIKLQTVQHRLQLTDRFHSLVTCLNCKRIHPKDITYETHPNCSGCGGSLWDLPERSRYTTMLGRRPPPPTPKLLTPYRPIKYALRDIFTSHPELVDLCMRWQDKASEDGVYERVMDGKIWKEMRRRDGSLFFDRNIRDSLRIGIFINMDWCVPFNLVRLNELAYRSQVQSYYQPFCAISFEWTVLNHDRKFTANSQVCTRSLLYIRF